jgi:hypothetical protein
MKHLKLLMLLFIGVFFIKGVSAQANVTLNMLVLNSGDIIANGGPGVLQATVGNTGPSAAIPAGRLNLQVSVPAEISISAVQNSLPAGWTIRTISSSVINICNSSASVAVNTQVNIPVALLGGTVLGPSVSSIIGQMTFRNNCTAPGGAVAGDNSADNAGSAGFVVVPGAVCGITAASASAGTIACNGGTTTLTVTGTGGTAPFEYSINGGAFQSSNTFTVPAGSYTATVREAANTSCSATATAVVVSEPTALSASNTASAISCFGGNSSVVISATGGTAPYTGTGTFSQAAGTQTYTVTDANGCTATTTVSVTQPAAALTASSTQTAIVCGGTSTVVISATGGTAPYTGTGTFSQPAGAQTYTVTDANGCTTTVTVTVTAPNGPAVTATQTAIACFGGTSTVVVSATGGTAPYTGTGSFTQAAGTQSYTVTDANGCTGTVAVTVTQPAQVPAPGISVVNNGNGTFTLTATSFSGSLLWSTGATTASILVSTAGTYSVTQTVAGCTSPAASQNIVIGNAIADPAVGQMFFTTLSNTTASANTLLFTQNYKLKVPVFNLNQFTEIPSSAINFTINLGTKLELDPAFNLATAPLSQYFSFTTAIVAGRQVITGTQIATIPADFDGIAEFEVKGTLSCTSGIASNIVITNASASLTDEDLNNNAATLQYTLPVTVTATAVNVTCNGAANGNITVVASPGTTIVIRNAANTVVTAPFAPGVYTVTASAVGDAPLSNTCSNTATVTITEPVVLTAVISGTTPAICNGGNTGTLTVVPAGGTAPYTYVIAGPTVNTTGANNGIFTGLAAGSYTVTVTDANGCTVTTAAATVGQPSGTVPDISLGSDITGSLFATNGTSQTIVYNITEIAGNPAVGDTLRITKVAGFDITFDAALTSTTITPTTYVLDNPNWKVDNSNPAFISIILKAPLDAPGPGTINCAERRNIAITLTRNTTNISTFPLSARLRRANGELNLSNNFNSIVFTAE